MEKKPCRLSTGCDGESAAREQVANSTVVAKNAASRFMARLRLCMLCIVKKLCASLPHRLITDNERASRSLFDSGPLEAVEKAD
jgi:hypothetical protein